MSKLFKSFKLFKAFNLFELFKLVQVVQVVQVVQLVPSCLVDGWMDGCHAIAAAAAAVAPTAVVLDSQTKQTMPTPHHTNPRSHLVVVLGRGIFCLVVGLWTYQESTILFSSRQDLLPTTSPKPQLILFLFALPLMIQVFIQFDRLPIKVVTSMLRLCLKV